MIRAIAFDLDGTLIDTAPDLAAALNRVLAMLGRNPVSESHVPRFVGAGLSCFIERALAASDRDTPATPAVRAGAEALFRKLYGEHPFERSSVCAGVRQTLRALDALALPLCCVTNKESGFALRVLEAADLARYFACVLCADLAEDRKPSPNLLLAACAKLGIEPDELLYVGDSRTDIIAARAAGCRIVAVTYGYQTHEALAALRPDGLIDDMRELMRLVRIPTVVEPHTIGRELAD